MKILAALVLLLINFSVAFGMDFFEKFTERKIPKSVLKDAIGIHTLPVYTEEKIQVFKLEESVFVKEQMIKIAKFHRL